MASMCVLHAAWLCLLIPGGCTTRGLVRTEGAAACKLAMILADDDDILILESAL